ncbi:MAG TPA: RecQ family ATP-dependent DNA helicase [Bacteroidetes bacterium]|nr:RecQ family ATP-dependent DNA helicase [Bacteroidota bacterium]
MNLYQQILTKYWGYSSFRPLQDEIIKSVVNGHDTLGLMPTGGGKSLTYQVPALARDGLCLVVTPLIALMTDQVARLKNLGIKAMAIHSGLTREEIIKGLDNCLYGDYKLLYVSPERLGTELFLSRVEKLKVNLLAVDEAHCISQWGYDFRPSYLKVAELRKFLPGVPVLALTATATEEVVQDIQEKLLFREKNVLRVSFERKNLIYLVRQADDKLGYLLRIISKTKGSGIVYVRSRRKARDVSDWLKQQKVSVDYYHAGLRPETRHARQKEWMEGKTDYMVATNAFGMGIDKEDVRVVVHYDVPESVESYFQEAGRAGRDGRRAYAVLLYHPQDIKGLEKRVDLNFPPIAEIKRIYELLGNYLQIPIGGAKGMPFDFFISEFCERFNLNLTLTFNALKVLEREGYVELTEEISNPSRIHFLVNRDDLYRFQVANARFDGFIKLLLRSYSGVFSEYVAIHEDFLARKSNLPPDTVTRYLIRLRELGIIQYIPKRRSPLLIYTEERLETKSLYISPEKLNFRKERYIERLQRMIAYVQQTGNCRSRFLLEYFGEKLTRPCGHCDICMEKDDPGPDREERETLRETIREALSDDPLSPAELVEKMKGDEEKILRVVRWLLDQELLGYDGDQRLIWRG